MTNEYQIRVQPNVAANEQALRSWLADEYGFDVRTLTAVRILRRSIDARQRTIFVNLKVRCYINEQPQQDEYVPTVYPDDEVKTFASANATWRRLPRRSRSMPKATIVLARVGQEPILTVSYTHVQRSVVRLRKFSMCSANMALRRIFWLMPIHILAPISCRVSLRLCVTPFSVVVVKYISRRK